MTVLRTHILRCLTLMLVATAAQAQDSNWYKVELLIFRQGGNAGLSAEQWEPMPTLRYPNNLRFLIDPRRVARNAANWDGESEIDDHGRQHLHLPVEVELEPIEVLPSASDQLAAITANTDENGEEASSAAQPQAFVTLPPSELELGGKAAYMQKSGRYSTLLHESWLQTAPSQSQAISLALDYSGDFAHDNAQWPQLQGSIKLYVSRYFHLQTNLWVNTDGRYLPGEWQMPPPPLAPKSLIVETPIIDDAVEAMPEPLVAEATLNPALAALPANTPALEEEPAVSPYPYRHALLLQQSRRMRSGEIHYIDHPVLGLVIKITALDEEALAALAPATQLD